MGGLKTLTVTFNRNELLLLGHAFRNFATIQEEAKKWVDNDISKRRLKHGNQNIAIIREKVESVLVNNESEYKIILRGDYIEIIDDIVSTIFYLAFSNVIIFSQNKSENNMLLTEYVNLKHKLQIMYHELKVTKKADIC